MLSQIFCKPLTRAANLSAKRIRFMSNSAPSAPLLTFEHKFKWPQGISIEPLSDRTYISDTRDAQIHAFDCESGKKLLSFGSMGSEPGQFKNPTGVAVSLSGHVYVADCANDRVQVFDQNGKFMFLFNEGVSKPWSLSFDHMKQELHVVNFSTPQITVHSMLDGAFVRSYGSEQKMDNPIGVAIDFKNGVSYVAEETSDLIKMYSLESGQKISEFPHLENGPRGDCSFKYIAVDPKSERVVIADERRAGVHVFSLDGKKLGVLETGSGKVAALAFKLNGDLLIGTCVRVPIEWEVRSYKKPDF